MLPVRVPFKKILSAYVEDKVFILFRLQREKNLMLGIISNEILVFLFLLFFSSPFKKNKKVSSGKRKSESGLPKLTAPLNRLFSIEMSTKAFTMSSIHQKLFFNLQSNPIQKNLSRFVCLFFGTERNSVQYVTILLLQKKIFALLFDVVLTH